MIMVSLLIAVLKRGEVCPMPAEATEAYAQSYLIFRSRGYILSPTLAGDRTANTTGNTTVNYIAHCIASKDTQNLQCGCLSDLAA